MHRYIVVSLLCVLVASAAVLIAAPSPFPRTTGPWSDGWDKPINPDGDCTFHTAGNKLTISLPGTELGHTMGALSGGNGNAPRLLRNVEGAFAVQVRVDAVFQPESGGAAGIVLTDGQQSVTVNRTWWEETAIAFHGRAAYLDITRHKPKERSIEGWFQIGPTPTSPGYIHLQRQGSVLTMKWSEDGEKWTDAIKALTIALPQKLKVGVVAQSACAGVFKVVFDKWQLTQIESKSGNAERLRD